MSGTVTIMTGCGADSGYTGRGSSVCPSGLSPRWNSTRYSPLSGKYSVTTPHGTDLCREDLTRHMGSGSDTAACTANMGGAPRAWHHQVACSLSRGPWVHGSIEGPGPPTAQLGPAAPSCRLARPGPAAQHHSVFLICSNASWASQEMSEA